MTQFSLNPKPLNLLWPYMHALILHAMHILNMLTILLCTGYYLIIFFTTCCFSHHNLSFDLTLTPVSEVHSSGWKSRADWFPLKTSDFNLDYKPNLQARMIKPFGEIFRHTLNSVCQFLISGVQPWNLYTTLLKQIMRTTRKLKLCSWN